jgi:hypothetical protein
MRQLRTVARIVHPVTLSSAGMDHSVKFNAKIDY